jgi:AcrR family transcriptional regulator
LEAAVRAIRRLGPDASMEELAAEAGLTKPILYTHFGDKSGLATAIAERFAAGLVEDVMASFAAGTQPREAVRRAIDTFIAFVEREPHVYRFLARGVAASENTLVNQRLVIEVGLRLADVLRDQLQDAGIDAGAAELWAFGVLGSVFVGAEWWLFRQTMTRDELVDHLTELAWSGLFGSATAVAVTTERTDA